MPSLGVQSPCPGPLLLMFNLQSCQNDSEDFTGYSSTVEIGLIYPTVHYHKLILHGVFACQKSANMYAFNSPCVYEPISPPSCVLYMYSTVTVYIPSKELIFYLSIFSKCFFFLQSSIIRPLGFFVLRSGLKVPILHCIC